MTQPRIGDRVTITTPHVIPCGLDGTITAIDKTHPATAYQITTDSGVPVTLGIEHFVIDSVDRCAGRTGVGGGMQ
jgi:hypothetical protein